MMLLAERTSKRNGRMNVQLFIPCFVDQLYPDTAFNMIKVLERAGCTVTYNPAQTCCGQPAFNAGFLDDARAVCSKFLSDFDADSPIVAPSASCVGFVRNYYSKAFRQLGAAPPRASDPQ
jgi:L-lactate dehydrogenase complex protein LldE